MLVGKAAKRGASILSPFWIIAMTVRPGVTDGEMRETREGGMSGQFLVVVTM